MRRLTRLLAFARSSLLLPVMLALPAPHAAASDLTAETIAAWDRYVAGAAIELQQHHATDPEGAMTEIRGGTVHHWRGSTLVCRTSVDAVLKALMYPGTPPPQEDVLESRVLSRTRDSLHVYLKLSRSAIVTVVYDTEHDVTFQRHSSRLATSRSVATKITESGGGDRGFLWRLNSYWRYTQVGGDVRIDLTSLSLSREVPWIARSIAGPLINRVARESMARTLSSVRRFLNPGPQPCQAT
jgi:hypothetical protein